MPEPLNVRSITYAPMGTTAHVVHTSSFTHDHAGRSTRMLDVPQAPGYTVNAGTYLHRDDVAALLESMADEDDDAADALRDAARQIRTRGQS